MGLVVEGLHRCNDDGNQGNGCDHPNSLPDHVPVVPKVNFLLLRERHEGGIPRRRWKLLIIVGGKLSQTVLLTKQWEISDTTLEEIPDSYRTVFDALFGTRPHRFLSRGILNLALWME